MRRFGGNEQNSPDSGIRTDFAMFPPPVSDVTVRGVPDTAPSPMRRQARRRVLWPGRMGQCIGGRLKPAPDLGALAVRQGSAYCAQRMVHRALGDGRRGRGRQSAMRGLMA